MGTFFILRVVGSSFRCRPMRPSPPRNKPPPKPKPIRAKSRSTTSATPSSPHTPTAADNNNKYKYRGKGKASDHQKSKSRPSPWANHAHDEYQSPSSLPQGSRRPVRIRFESEDNDANDPEEKSNRPMTHGNNDTNSPSVDSVTH